MYASIEERSAGYSIVNFQNQFTIYKNKKKQVTVPTENEAHDWIKEDMEGE